MQDSSKDMRLCPLYLGLVIFGAVAGCKSGDTLSHSEAKVVSTERNAASVLPAHVDAKAATNPTFKSRLIGQWEMSTIFSKSLYGFKPDGTFTERLNQTFEFKQCVFNCAGYYELDGNILYHKNDLRD